MHDCLVFVFATQASERALAPRTLRALRGRGLSPIDATSFDAPELAKRIQGRTVWLVRAGAFPVWRGTCVFPPPSALSLPLAAIGASLRNPSTGHEERAAAFERLTSQTGGDFSNPKLATLPPLSSVYLERALSNVVAAKIAAGENLERILLACIHTRSARVVRFPPLDVLEDEALRVALVVTSLQQGGAERMVLDLAATLPKFGIRPRIVTLGRPTRDPFDAPKGTIDLMAEKDRIFALAEICKNEAMDLVHAHLVTGDDLKRLRQLHAPEIVVTVHNTREGWPLGLAELQPVDVSLLIACSLIANDDLAQSDLTIPHRTVWNGIDLDRWRFDPVRAEEGRNVRKRLGFGETDYVFVAVANPRPQKRLELLGPLLAAVRARFAEMGIRRQARLLFVGDDDPQAETAQRSLQLFRAALERENVNAHVRFVGSTKNVAAMLAAADALVSTSAHEGLSLAHLEALAMGLSVFATDAGGTREIQFQAPMLHVFPKDGGPLEMGRQVADIIAQNAESRRPAPPLSSFSRHAMAHRYAMFYRRTLAHARTNTRRRGLLLVTNNFSTGGAQSSARRLLLGLTAAGEHVRAVVLQEQPEWPTIGRQALVDAGISVLALPPAGSIDITHAIQKLCAWIDEDPPEAVVFWNALAQYKLWLADQLLDIPIFDVSPGEMFFDSLEKFFAKQQGRFDIPIRHARDYGARLSGVIVKYAAEATKAEQTLGAPTWVVPNGVPLPPITTHRTPKPYLLLGTSARLSPQKKLEELLAAFRLALPRLPPCKLLIAGGQERGCEEYAQTLQKQAEGLPIEWLGDVDVSRMLRQIDLFLMISEPAGCPNASLEAMAEGIPVIATDFGGASEQVINDISGRLVPRGDVRAFADALIALGNDPPLRMALGQGARRHMEEKFDVLRMIADYQRILLSQNRRPRP
mgnify:CR=1 FL=1